MSTKRKNILQKLSAKTALGLRGVTIGQISSFLIREVGSDSIQARSAALAYQGLLATFPGILFLFTLISYVPIDNFKYMLLDLITGSLPDKVQAMAAKAVVTIDALPRTGWLIWVGVIFGLYFASNGMRFLLMVFRKADPDFRKRKFIDKQAVSLGLTLMLTILVVGTILVLVVGSSLLQIFIDTFHVEQKFSRLLLTSFKRLLSTLLVFNSVSILYRYAPAMYHKWRYINIGAIVASIFIIIATIGFSYIMSNIAQIDKIWGSFGALITVMIWYYIIALAIIIGFELNMGIHINRRRLIEGYFEKE